MKVAVLIPVYNAAEYLPQCLDSVLVQTLPGVEAFCLDDGSTDGALAVCRDYERRFPGRVHVDAWENHGVALTLNRLMDALPAVFDAYAIVDCDDYIHPRALELMTAAMERDGSDVVECGVFDVPGDAVYPQGCETALPTGSLRIDDMSVYQLRATAPGRWILYWNKLYRRAAVSGIRLRKGLDYEDDFFFSYEVHAAIGRKTILEAGLHAYRANPNSVTGRVRFWQYVPSAIERIRLSCEVFLNAGRIPEGKVRAFRRELAKDAYRMIVRKNLRQNRDPEERLKMFGVASRGIAALEKECGFVPEGLNPLQRIIWAACRRGDYLLARTLVRLT